MRCREFNALLDGAVRGDGSDDTAALSAACVVAAAAGVPLIIPPAPCGVYQISSSIVAPAPITIRGAPGATVIRTSSASADLCRIGAGVSPAAQFQNGSISGVHFVGASQTPAANGQAGLKLLGVTQFRVQDVQIDGTDIGVDALDNCFGLQLENLRVGFANSCNVGVNLRPGPQSGNQTRVESCWISGGDAAFHLWPGYTGLIVTGGQLSSSGGAGTDGQGAIRWGMPYPDDGGARGGVGTVALWGVDFEGMGAWVLRGFGPISLIVAGCDILANGPTPALGLLKLENACASYVNLGSNNWGGAFRSPVPVVVTGDYGASAFRSKCWTNGNGSLSFAGVPVNFDLTADPLALSGVPLVPAGLQRYRAEWVSFTGNASITAVDGVWMRGAGGAMQTSIDAGATWK